jgi:hypothetical protein
VLSDGGSTLSGATFNARIAGFPDDIAFTPSTGSPAHLSKLKAAPDLCTRSDQTKLLPAYGYDLLIGGMIAGLKS